MDIIQIIISSLGKRIESAFRWVFRRTALKGCGLKGHGYVTRKDTGKREKFYIEGDVTDAVLERAMQTVSTRLYGALGGGPFKRMLGAVTHPTAVRNTIADAVVDLVDAGAGAGILRFETSGAVEVATLTYSDPAFGNAASGTATANAITSDTNATGGTVAQSETRDSNGTAVFLTAVGTSGSDINLSSLAVGSGDTVSMSSLTYSAPS